MKNDAKMLVGIALIIMVMFMTMLYLSVQIREMEDSILSEIEKLKQENQTSEFNMSIINATFYGGYHIAVYVNNPTQAFVKTIRVNNKICYKVSLHEYGNGIEAYILNYDFYWNITLTMDFYNVDNILLVNYTTIPKR